MCPNLAFHYGGLFSPLYALELVYKSESTVIPCLSPASCKYGTTVVPTVLDTYQGEIDVVLGRI